MPEIDDVVLRLRVDLQTYLNGVRLATKTVDQQLGIQGRRAHELETQMRKSSGAIGASIKGLAATFAAAFTGREVIGLIDGFSRLQNSLRVAGLEGENLAAVQERLRGIGAQYGVEIEALASVFNRATLAQKELGASQEEIIRLNEVIAASLKVTGSSTEQASGALLQLAQTLGSDIVRGEEFNSILEGALPIAQAAARGIERFGGSVAKLRAEVVEGNVTSKEFFEGILRGGVETIKQAESATLTLGGAFTVLRNELTLYVGQAAEANGVSGALAAGIRTLADNLDLVANALAVIAAVALGRGAGALAGLAAQTLGAASANVALSAAAAGATTSLNVLAIRATLAGRAMLAAFGGPVGIAVTALTIGIAFLATRTDEVAQATGVYARVQRESKAATDSASQAAEALASAHGKARDQAVALAKAERENVKQKLASAQASLLLAEAEAVRAREAGRRDVASASRSSAGAGGGPDRLASATNRQGNSLAQARANVQAAEGSVIALQQAVAKIDSAINAGPRVGGASTPDASKASKSVGPSGPSAADILNRFNSELASIAQQTLSAQQQLATTTAERAELETRSVELARIRALAEIKADQDYSASQKERLAAQIELLAEFEREGIARALIAENERISADLAEEEYRARDSALRLQFDLANNQADRKRIALEILDAEDAFLRSKLEALALSDAANEDEKRRAKIALAALNAQSGARREAVARSNETDGQRFLRSLDPEGINDAIDGIKIDGLQNLNNQLVDAILNAESLGDIFSNVAKSIVADLLRIAIQQAVIQPLAQSLFGGSGGGGGGFFASIAGAISGSSRSGGGNISAGGFGSSGGIFARASGGPVAPRQVYRINEGASPGRVEGFVGPSTGGNIVPLGRMNAARGGAQAVGGTIRLELSGDIDARMINIAGPVAVEVVRTAMPTIVDTSAAEALRRSSRPRI